MAMGHRQTQQEPLFITHQQLPKSAGHPFYQALERELVRAGFDPFVESLCIPHYAEPLGRPSIAPGLYFRCLFIGYFEGIRSERGIAWRICDSLSLRSFLGLGVDKEPPNHATLSRTRQRLPESVCQQVFDWVLGRLGEAGLVCGRTVGIDASTLEANAAMRSIVRRDSGQSYREFLKELAQAEGIAEPTAADMARVDRKRKKKGSNAEWKNPHDPEARITKMKDGRTHLAYKDEQAVDLDTGAILSVMVQPGDTGDTQSLPATLAQAEASLVAIKEPQARERRPESGIEEVVTDKGYHSDETLRHCQDKGLRSYISEPKQKRKWKGKPQQRRTYQGNGRRVRGRRGKGLLRRRGELLERPFAHRLGRGDLRRTHVRGRLNVKKQELLLCAAQNLGLLMRRIYGVGTPRRLADRARQARACATGLYAALLVLLSTLWAKLQTGGPALQLCPAPLPLASVP